MLQAVRLRDTPCPQHQDPKSGTSLRRVSQVFTFCSSLRTLDSNGHGSGWCAEATYTKDMKKARQLAGLLVSAG